MRNAWLSATLLLLLLGMHVAATGQEEAPGGAADGVDGQTEDDIIAIQVRPPHSARHLRPYLPGRCSPTGPRGQSRTIAPEQTELFEEKDVDRDGHLDPTEFRAMLLEDVHPDEVSRASRCSEVDARLFWRACVCALPGRKVLKPTRRKPLSPPF